MSENVDAAQKPKKSIAAMTFTYNENVNLPLWIKYYGAACGEDNLFIADRGSNDGSVDRVGKANLLKLPRHDFDEFEKTDFINNMHSALLNFYDFVVYTDCDEFLVPDPNKHLTLNDYVQEMAADCVRAIGIDVLHILDNELPLDLSRPVLSQRSFGRFGSPSCKALITKVPLKWLPGFHSCDRKIEIDLSLALFHLKYMDYGMACARQVVNNETIWSKRSLDRQFGGHHRWNLAQFVHHGFFVPSDVFKRDGFGEFDLTAEVETIHNNTALTNGFWRIPTNVYKWIRIPDRFRNQL